MRKFEKVSRDFNESDIITLPQRSDKGSAGYDLSTPFPFTIEPNQLIKIATGIKVSMELDEVFLIYPRSSIGIKKNIMLANNVGVIDSTYYNNPDNEGEIIIALYNYGTEAQTFNAGDRIAQGIFTKYLITDDDIPVNTTRVGGIGSSGN